MATRVPGGAVTSVEQASRDFMEIAARSNTLYQLSDDYLRIMAALRRDEAKRLRARAEADERHAERLRRYLMTHMALIGSERIDTARFTVVMRDNPPAVEVLDEDQVPAEFRRVVTTTSVDKRAILEHFKATGEIVDGIEIMHRRRIDIR